MRKTTLVVSLLILVITVLCVGTLGAPAAIAAELSPPEDPGALHVSRATTCRSVVDREPADSTSEFSVADERVYLWCEIMNGSDTMITHVYSLDGEPMASVELHVRSDRFRTWSYKSLMPQLAGNWRAEILAEDGSVLYTTEFTVSEDGG